MDVAALVLSVVAIVVAAVSARYTRSQAHHQQRVADIETERRAGEVAAQRQADFERKRARLGLHVEREPNTDGSIDEPAFIHAIVVSNEGPAEAADLEIEIVSSWNDPLGTGACFVSGERRCRVGRLPARHRESLRLRSDPDVDFGDIGDCRVRWRDAASAEVNEAMRPARPDWV